MILLAVGIILILGAGIPSNPLILPLWFGSIGSQRGGLLPLHPGMGRLTGVACIVLWFVLRRSDSPVLIVALSGIVFILLAVAMIMGVTQGIRR
ncbi:hypothetical protein KQI63_04550 [bacterium]|nr:hypothetical protein [bacterium]